MWSISSKKFRQNSEETESDGQIGNGDGLLITAKEAMWDLLSPMKGKYPFRDM